ncbi:hypothetical protein EB796_005964 [Bugula neritina]|uniref:Uncharacterized protein n=1 Tax=Bugula neritina TaxID=10212 RepID=A0A7J7KDN0_BUGNE|nr:hypothetical protein EB796_005964 [Bugula neritina]
MSCMFHTRSSLRNFYLRLSSQYYLLMDSSDQRVCLLAAFLCYLITVSASKTQAPPLLYEDFEFRPLSEEAYSRLIGIKQEVEQQTYASDEIESTKFIKVIHLMSTAVFCYILNRSETSYMLPLFSISL